MKCVHFVGFDPTKNEMQYWNAVQVFGPPDFVHRFWDSRAAYGGEYDSDSDVRVFAKGTDQDEPKMHAYDDSAYQ